MIDKPKGKTEILMEKFFDWCKNKVKLIEEKTESQRNTAKAFSGKHPRAARTIGVTVCTLALSLVIVGFATPKTVIVNIDDSVEITTKKYETTCIRVDSFIENHGIDFVYGQDIMDAEMYTAISDGMEINIKKEVQIPVTADGETQVVTTFPIKASDLLKELGIKVGENDIVEPGMDETLYKGDELIVRRVTTGYVKEEKEVPYSSVTRADNSMAIGNVEVVQEGVTGREKNTYLVTYIDGEESTRELVETEVLKEKKDKITHYGMGISSGKPAGMQYSRKISNVRAVSYHFGGSPRGSYGLPCTYGTCAVDSDVIPLGSLLYIEGYGYAIANDVGGAIKGNTVDVYMEDLRQCHKWGARTVNVYVVK